MTDALVTVSRGGKVIGRAWASKGPIHFPHDKLMVEVVVDELPPPSLDSYSIGDLFEEIGRRLDAKET